MKIGIMQPYFFPYIGYFCLIKYVDEFMLFDPTQFIKHGWIERNRIIKPNGGWQYIAVPLIKHSHTEIIKNIKINNNDDWKDLVIRQLAHYKSKAKYFEETINVIKKGLDIETDSIVDLNRNVIAEVCKYLGIKTKITVFSELNLKIETPQAPDEWALNICRALKEVKEYINPPGGVGFFDKKKYDKYGLGLRFLSCKITPYVQKIGYFEPGLSIIDVMMYNSVEDINKMLDDYEFLESEVK